MLKTKSWYDVLSENTNGNSKDNSAKLDFLYELASEALRYLRWNEPAKYDEFVRVAAARRGWEAVEYVEDKKE
jgi:hypothetical protein